MGLCLNAGMCRQLAVLFLACALLVWAASAVATVSASGSFKLNGVEVPATAANSVPANLGDRIATDKVEAAIRFGNDCVITLERKSSAEIAHNDGRDLLRLLSGSLRYSFAPSCKLGLYNRNEMATTAGQGSLSVAAGHKALPIALVSGGAAAAVITTVALTDRSSSAP